MSEHYNNSQVDATGSKIGGNYTIITNEVVTKVTQVQGQSTTEAVSQKLFTDTVGEMALALQVILGEDL